MVYGLSMENRWCRSIDEERRASSSSLMNHRYSSYASVASSAQPSFEVGFDNGSLIYGPINIPGNYLLERIRKERMRDEMLAREIARNRMLEEVILREMEYMNHFSINDVEGNHRFDHRLEHGFKRSPFDHRIIKNDDGEIGGFRRLDVDYTPCTSWEMPQKSLDMKFPTNKLFEKKRKATSSLPLPAKKKWNCSFCCVTATSEEDLNCHFEGKMHKLKEAQLKAASSGNSNADSSLEDDCEYAVDKEKKFSVKKLAIDKAHRKGEKHQYSKKTGWWCTLCQAQCNSEAMLQFHLAGKKHKARMATTFNSKNGEVVPKEGDDV